MELPKAYEPGKYEDEIYKRWEESGFFNPDNLNGEPYSIMMPPPNVTGVLHLGHALENALMDTMARYQRMQGKKVLLVPGTDHAAVATQAKVEKLLVESGIKNPRQELGREKLLQKIREYSEQSKATILNQVKKLGTSADWSRLAYTFDDKRSAAVNEMFIKMYNDGLIYRGYRVVNWSVKGQSTCSDDELVYVERPSKLYTFKYSKEFPISIATTRPETKLGDTAVAVHPKGKWKKYIGKEFEIKDFGQTGHNLTIKIIADENVDPEFGTGALGVTPAHSAVDFEMYEKQKAAGKPIDIIPIIDTNGKLNSAAGSEYAGLTVNEAREKVVIWLKENNLLEKEEDIVQNIGTSDRFGDIVEALPLTQWFVAVNKEIPGRGKTLKDLMIEAVKTGHQGNKKQKVKITPDRFEKIYFNWINNLRDWCVSRQIWWGHRIPVWYKGDKLHVGVTVPDNTGWEQDPDTLDTWFSSGTWTFSTLGWPSYAQGASAGKPNKTDDLKNFHPSSWMQMGYEILFFWMARMILMSTYALDTIPFQNVYIHGILRDESGKKFSKSSGNNIDPLDVIKDYGTDALRWSMINGISPGNDSKFYEEKIEGSRNLINKLWNVCRFMLLNIEKPKSDADLPDLSSLADAWIIERLNNLITEVESNIEKFNFSYAGEVIRDFTWNDLADWYLEIAKIQGGKWHLLNYILNTLLKLWHPFAPFVTETIWRETYGSGSLLMIQKWPEVIKIHALDRDFQQMQIIKDVITGIRTIRSENKIEPAKLLSANIGTFTNSYLLNEHSDVIKRLARLENLTITSEVEKPKTAVSFVVGNIEVHVDLSGAVDVEKEKARLTKEIDEVGKYVAAQEGKLNNPDFVARAPEKVVEGEKKKLADAKEKLVKLTDQLTHLAS